MPYHFQGALAMQELAFMSQVSTTVVTASLYNVKLGDLRIFCDFSSQQLVIVIGWPFLAVLGNSYIEQTSLVPALYPALDFQQNVELHFSWMA
eukprot:s304_g36.t1